MFKKVILHQNFVYGIEILEIRAKILRSAYIL